jgi:hypothetical protein
MTRAEAMDAIGRAGLEASEFEKARTAPLALAAGGSLFAYFDISDRIEEVETAGEGERSGTFRCQRPPGSQNGRKLVLR